MAAALAALGTVACSTTEVIIDGDGGGGSGAGTGGGGGDVLCEAHDDQDGTAITFRIHNDGFAPIYIPTSCGHLTPSITPIGGADGNAYGNTDSCFSSCETLQHSEPVACAEACALITHRIMPGESFDFVWAGTGLMPTSMPAACFFDASYGPDCIQLITAPSASYRFDIPAYDTCAGDCTCDADQCFGDATGLMGAHDPVSFAHPSETLVDVTFGGCAFGCP
jgi:hypothetical protein